MEKRLGFEGNGYSQLIQLMRKHGYNKDVDIAIGTVLAPPPSIKVKLDDSPIELDKDDLIVAEQLTEHTRKVTLQGGSISEAMSTEGYYSHTHDITSLAFTEANLTIHSPLKVGDRVIVACLDDKMQYVILDKAVTF